MSQVVAFCVILPDTFGGAETGTARTDEVDVEVVCNCEPGHKKDAAGCGFGKGIAVSLRKPDAA
jgi:hypothetical protein